MSIDDWKNVTASIQSVVTAASFIIGGFWAYQRFVRQQERYPNIEFSAELNFVGTQGEWWIVELIAVIDNKGKAQHRMKEFHFDLNGLFSNDAVDTAEQWGGQINFGRELARGSFLPARSQYFFVDPGVRAKYSYLARVPIKATYVILHSWFGYADERKLSHTAECTASVPVAAATG